ncbi:MAG: diguanylate cyclase [Clostridiales bacterium]
MDNKRFRIGFFTYAVNQKYQSDIFAGIVESAIKNDVDIIRFTLDLDYNFYKLDNQYALLCNIADNLNLDGILYSGWISNPNKLKNRLSNTTKIPIINIGIKDNEFPSVYQDSKICLELLVDHFLNYHKYNNIVFICPIISDDRINKYINIMKSYNKYDPNYIITTDDINSYDKWNFHDRVKKIDNIIFNIRKIKVDAIFSMYSDEIILLNSKLKERNLKIPDDIALASWEESKSCKFNIPPITTIYYPFYEAGYTSCNILINILSQREFTHLNKISSKIFYRKSCGCEYSAFKKINDCIFSPKDNLLSLDSKSNSKIIESLNLSLNLMEPVDSLEKLKESLTENNSTIFCTWLENKCYNRTYSIDQLELLQEDILSLRSNILPYISDYKELNFIANNIWIKCQFILTKLIGRSFALNENNENIFSSDSLKDIELDLKTVFDIDKIKKILEINLSKLGIRNCFIYRLKKNSKNNYLPKSLFLFQNNKSLNTHNYDTKKYNLEKLFEGERHTYLFHILHVRDFLIGCAFYELGIKNDKIYSSLSIEISSALKSTSILNDLQSANDEIRKQMDIINIRTEELELSNQKLSDLDNLKNDFIANITHDFRSPLMIILNNTDLGLKYDHPNKNIKNRYQIIYESSLKLKSSIDRLLELAKMDSQGIKLQINKQPIKGFLNSVSNFYKSALINSNIEVIDKTDNRELYIYTDITILEEVLNNIISNAMKFTNPINGKIIINLEELKNSILITISDNGIGIPKDKLKMIFGRFEQIESGIKSSYKGTGIGLAFSRQLIEYLKGRIWAESDGIGKGSKFIIQLMKGYTHYNPIDLNHSLINTTQDNTKRIEFKKLLETELKSKFESKNIETIFKNLNKENEFNSKKSIILIVDDNVQIRKIITEYLKNNGYQNLILACDGLQGVNAAYKYRPDLILCDFSMPIMCGDKFHDELVNNPDFKKTPFIFITAIVGKNILLERKKKGALAYLNKPIDESELILTVEMHLTKYMELKSTLYQASIDELTQINNKRNLKFLLKKQFSIRILRDISIIFFDLDHFKLINDNFGHQVGDMVLHKVGEIIRENIRPYDIAGRYGGEEFIIALPETSAENAFIVAEKLRTKIETSFIDYKDNIIKFTSSFGIAALIRNTDLICKELEIKNLNNLFNINPVNIDNWEEIERKKKDLPNILILLADKALYYAKKTKCNNCNFSSDKANDFPKQKCPKCSSERLIQGRNRTFIIKSFK